jgi:DNA invertase Pin-like site-specific DNA recombinase
MIIGYARTSTAEQIAGLEAQERDLNAVGAEKLFIEQISSGAQRKALEDAIEFAREGDTLVVTKLDRLARSVANLCDIQRRLEAKRVALRILSMGLDTSTASGKLMVNVFASVAQFEREVMLERQREGIAKAKQEGAYKGRKPTARQHANQIAKLVADGKKGREIADELGISVRSVRRYSEGEAA